MRSLLFLFVFCMLVTPVAAQTYNIPDANFRTKLTNTYGITFDGSHNITNPDSAMKITALDVSNQNITNLAGIEAFTALTTLQCSYNQLTSLDVSSNIALSELGCSYNQLTSLDASSNTALSTLFCFNNTLTSLNVSGATVLTQLFCSYNQLTSLDVSSNTELLYLYCSYNQLTSLNVSGTAELTQLLCNNNQLTSLDVSSNTALLDLYCDYNQLTSLNVSSNTTLKQLGCNSNQLTSLDVSLNTALTELMCGNNFLTSLDVPSSLLYLHCTNNQLMSLNVSANTVLTQIECSNNQITSLDLTSNTALTRLECSNNQITSLDLTSNIELTYMDCSDNVLTNLNVTANTALWQMRCQNNQLMNLNVSSNTALQTLHCDSNQLSSLNVSSNPALKTLLCYNNQLTSLNVSSNTALTYLQCQSNRIPIVLTDGSVTTLIKDAITQAATFRSSAQNPSIGSSLTGGYVLGSTGAIVNVTANTGSTSTIMSSTGTNPTVVGSLPVGTINILSDKYWTITNANLTGMYNLILDLTPVSGILTFNNLRVLQRTDASSPWLNVNSIPEVTVQYFEPFVLINGLTSFSEFALANFDITLPSAPQNLTSTAGDGQVTIKWYKNTEPDFSRYRIYRSTSPNASVQVDSASGGIADTTRTYSGLAFGTTYYFRVTAVDTVMNVSAYSNEANASPLDLTPLLAPQNLTATAGDGQVSIKWRRNTEADFSKYRIYRSTSANATTQIDSSSTVADTSRTYTGLTKGTTYFFRVTAVDNANNLSAYSNEVSATVFAVSPTITTAILQNPALSIYFDVVVVSLSDLASSPSVKLWITGTTDTTNISMSVLSGSPHVYTGAGEFGSSGTYNIRTRATTPSGGDTTQTNTYAVTLAKPGVVTKMLALDNMASLQINKTSIKRETYFTAQLNETPSGIIYQFGPAGVEFAEALDVEIIYDPLVYPDAGKLFVYRKDGEEWTVLRSQVYLSRNAVKAKVTRLGEFKIVYDASFAGSNIVPTDYALSQNYPNPFNPSTTIRYGLPEDGFLTIKVYNLLGQEVRTLVRGDQLAGVHSVLWDGRNAEGRAVASGIYLYRLQTKQFTQTKKMLFIK